MPTDTDPAGHRDGAPGPVRGPGWAPPSYQVHLLQAEGGTKSVHNERTSGTYVPS